MTVILAGILLILTVFTAVAYLQARRTFQKLEERWVTDWDDFHRQLDRERVIRDQSDQGQAVQIAVLEADLRAAQLIEAELGRQLAGLLDENEGIIRFLADVPQNFGLHLEPSVYKMLLPDRLKLEYRQ
jgi:hypothetical protein